MRKRSRSGSEEHEAEDAVSAAHRVLMETIKKAEAEATGSGKDPLAVALGRRGGLKGGPARAAKMSKAELTASALHAARARWRKKKPKR